MKEKIMTSLLNLIKVKSIVTFVTLYVFIYLVRTEQIDAATTTAILMLVFKELFDKNKVTKNGSDDNESLHE